MIKTNKYTSHVINKMDFWKSYELDYKCKMYKIQNVIIFDENGIITSFDSSELKGFGEMLEPMNNIALKRKVDLKHKGNFIISLGRDWTDLLTCNLYLHASEFETVESYSDIEMFGNAKHRYKVTTIAIENGQIEISRLVDVKHDYNKDFQDIKKAISGTLISYENGGEITRETLEKLKSDIEMACISKETQERGRY